MLLVFRLGRPDVLPVSDLGVRKGFMLTYGHDEMPKPSAILEHGERWRPFRSVATWYLCARRGTRSQNGAAHVLEIIFRYYLRCLL